MTAIKIARTCSQCGNYGHNARTCSEHVLTVGGDTHVHANGNSNSNSNSNSSNGSGVMLFGVRLTPVENSPSPRSIEYTSSTSSFRKCMSMNNMAQYEQQQIQLQHQQQQNSHESNNADVGGSGYVSDDALHANGSRNRERKRGVPWTEEEHRLFLMGLSQVGKGDWRGISRNFVKTRSPTQVASHAQKYFLRRTNLNRRRRRSSLFDITTDTMSRSASADQLHNLDTSFQPNQAKNQPTLFSPPCPTTLTPISTNQVVFELAPSSKMANLNLNQSPNLSPTSSSSSTNSTRDREFEPFLSLKTSQAPSDEEASRPTNFGGFNGNSGDNIISVA